MLESVVANLLVGGKFSHCNWLDFVTWDPIDDCFIDEVFYIF